MEREKIVEVLRQYTYGYNPPSRSTAGQAADMLENDQRHIAALEQQRIALLNLGEQRAAELEKLRKQLARTEEGGVTWRD